MWEALEAVQMKGYVTTLPGALDAPVSEGGNNLSVSRNGSRGEACAAERRRDEDCLSSARSCRECIVCFLGRSVCSWIVAAGGLGAPLPFAVLASAPGSGSSGVRPRTRDQHVDLCATVGESLSRELISTPSRRARTRSRGLATTSPFSSVFVGTEGPFRWMKPAP